VHLCAVTAPLACAQELLQACGRSHGLDDVRAALRAVADAAPAAWSLDLMAGLPRLAPALWEASLAQAVAARPDHISVYDLQVRRAGGCGRPCSGGGGRRARAPGLPVPSVIA